MHKRLLIIFNILLVFTEMQAQKWSANVQMGKPYAYQDASEQYYFRKENTIVSVKRVGNDIILQRMNAGSLQLEKALLYNDFPKGYSIEKVAQVGGEFYIFYSLEEKNTNSLFARKINMPNVEFIDFGKKILETTDDISDDISGSTMWMYNSLLEHGRYQFYFSGDRSKLAICYRLKSRTLDKSKSNEVDGVWVFDNTLTEQWKRNIELPYSERKIDVRKRVVDSKGVFHLFINKFNDNTTLQKKDGLPNYTLEVLSYSAGLQPLITPVNLGNRFIKNVALNEQNGNLVCSGYYNTGRDFDDAAGIFTVTLSGNGTHLPAVILDFSLDFINEGEAKGTKERNQKRETKDEVEIKFLWLKGTGILPDESLLILGEQQYVVQNNSGYNFHYNEGVIAKVMPDGKLAWINKLKKEQDGGSIWRGKSYVRLKGENGAHNFIFMDSKGNMERAPDEPVKSVSDGSSGVLACYRVADQTGESKKLFLTDTKKINNLRIFSFGVHRVIQLDDRSFVFEGEIRTPVDQFSSAAGELKQEVLIKVEMTE